MRDRVLIACIGNIFLGDDAFGCEVARLLAARPLPADVRLTDFGIRTYDLAYALLDGYETTILVDATRRGGAPGTVYVIEPERSEIERLAAAPSAFEPHNMNALKVLALVRELGGVVRNIYVVGCEPQFTGEETDGYMGLSEPVTAALSKAVEVVESLVSRALERSERIAA